MKSVLVIGFLVAAGAVAAQQAFEIEPYQMSEFDRENVKSIVRTAMTLSYDEPGATEFSSFDARQVGPLVHVCGFIRSPKQLAEQPFYVIVREGQTTGFLAARGSDFWDSWFVRDECARLGVNLPPSSQNPAPPRAWEGDTPPQPLPERTSESPPIIFPDEQPTAEAAPEPESVGLGAAFPAWHVEFDQSAFTDLPSVYVSGMSSRPAQCDSSEGFARLIFRCEENKTEMFLAHGCYTPTITRDVWPVDIRIDDGPMQTVQMAGSASNEALGFWNYGQARDFAEQLYGAERLLVRFRDYSGNSAELEFPVHGLEDAIAPLRETCGW